MNTATTELRAFGAAGPAALKWVGLIGFYWYFLTVFWGIDGHHAAALLMFGYLAYWAVGHWDDWKKSGLVWILVVSILYVMSRYSFAYITGEYDFRWSVDHDWAFLKISGFLSLILVPFFVAGNRVSFLSSALILTILSLFYHLVRLIFLGDDPRGLEHLTTHRPGFGMGPITFGIVSGFLMIGILALGHRFQAAFREMSMPIRAVTGGLIASLFGLFLLGLVLTQSVGPWAATIAGAVTLLTGWFLACGKRTSPAACRWRYFRRSAGVLALAAVLVGVNWETIESRLHSKDLTPSSLVAAGPLEIPETALGARFHLYQHGFSSVRENPLFGSLPGRVAAEMEASTGYSFPHVHNLPLQVLASFGIVGFSLLAAFIVLSLREIHLASRAKVLPVDWALFLYAAFVFFAVNSLFDLMLKNRELITLLSFLAAVPPALQIARLRTNRLSTGIEATRANGGPQ